METRTHVRYTHNTHKIRIHKWIKYTHTHAQTQGHTTCMAVLFSWSVKKKSAPAKCHACKLSTSSSATALTTQ